MYRKIKKTFYFFREPRKILRQEQRLRPRTPKRKKEVEAARPKRRSGPRERPSISITIWSFSTKVPMTNC